MDNSIKYHISFKINSSLFLLHDMISPTMPQSSQGSSAGEWTAVSIQIINDFLEVRPNNHFAEQQTEN
jgi:hypothetical protein